MAIPVSAAAIRTLFKEVEVSGQPASLAVGGARELAAVLRRSLSEDAPQGAVRASDSPEGAAVLLYVLGHEPTEEDEAALKRARRARTPIVVVAAGPVSDDVSIPYVLATDVVRVAPGQGFPLQAVADAIAGRLGEDAAPLAGRVPVLREAVASRLVSSFARRNGAVAAAVFVEGEDHPALTLNQLRLVLRLAQVYGQDAGRERMPELAATVAAGMGFRMAAYELLGRVPIAGWLVKGAVAYGGTRALGAAAIRRFELAAATPRPAAAAPAAP